MSECVREVYYARFSVHSWLQTGVVLRVGAHWNPYGHLLHAHTRDTRGASVKEKEAGQRLVYIGSVCARVRGGKEGRRERKKTNEHANVYRPHARTFECARAFVCISLDVLTRAHTHIHTITQTLSLSLSLTTHGLAPGVL